MYFEIVTFFAAFRDAISILSYKLVEEVYISGLGFGALYFSFLITRPSTLKKKDDIALGEFFFHMFFH